MKMSICIAGSGKIGRDAGMFFLTRGHAVHWVSGSEDRIVDLQTWVNKRVHLFLKRNAGGLREISACFGLYEELEDESFDVVFECTNESLNVKRDAFLRLAGRHSPDALLFSASSSILPSAIAQGCCGLHVFYPLELAGVAELIVPADLPPGKRDAAITFCKESGLTAIVQSEATAFAVNRMLLPLQNEVFRALRRGVCSADADAASASDLVAAGMCEFARGVGPAVVAAAVENYRSRMSAAEAALYGPLSSGLAAFDASIDGWKAAKPLAASERDAMATSLYYLFINTCLRFLERGDLAAADLNCALDRVLGATTTLEEAVSRAGKRTIAAALRDVCLSGGADYFEPSALLDAE